MANSEGLGAEEWGHFQLVPIELSSDEDLEALDLLFTEQIPDQENVHDAETVPDQASVSVTTASEKAPTFISVSNEDKENFVGNMRNQNTVKKTESSMKVFQRWLAEPPHLETRPFWQLQAAELDPLIGSFLLSIRKADGSEYEPDTLTSYHRSIDR
jgi:hypothetical protein